MHFNLYMTLYYIKKRRSTHTGVTPKLGLGPLCFYIYVIMLLSIMLSEFTILERDYANYMLA